jgi:katanin p80 WD40 repeat-containing subunit B1
MSWTLICLVHLWLWIGILFTLLSVEMECAAPMLKILMFLPGETRGHKINRDAPSIESQKGGIAVPDCNMRFVNNVNMPNLFHIKYVGRMRSLMINWEKRGSSPSYEGPTSGISAGTSSVVNVLPLNMVGFDFNFCTCSILFHNFLIT